MIKVQESFYEGNEIPIETFQLLRTAMQEHGSLADYKALLSSIPNDYPLKPQILAEMAAYVYQQGNSYDAESCLKLYPNNSSALDAYASFLKSEGRLNEAESVYQSILAIDDTAETRLKLGKVYIENENFSAAQ